MRSATQLCPILVAGFLACSGFAPAGRSWAAEKEVDLKLSREMVVGTTRVVLLQVSRTTEFTPDVGGQAPRAVTSVRVVYLMENLDDKPINLIYMGAEAFTAGTTDPAVGSSDPAVRGPQHSYQWSETYASYRKRVAESGTDWAVKRLPNVKDADKGVVVVEITFDDVGVKAAKADLRLSVGLHKGDEQRVLFRNVPLE
jgi:hypothetical protein